MQGELLQDVGHHNSPIKSVEMSSDNIHLLSTDESNEVNIWSLKEKLFISPQIINVW
jgi:hypothetical protein